MEAGPSLEAAHNFRDIGGGASRLGGAVARGRVFRSGELSRLTPGDHATLDRLGIRWIFDLRTTSEQSRHPSRLPTKPAFRSWRQAYEISGGDLREQLTRVGAGGSRQVMIELYRALPYEQAPAYRELLLRIASDETPVLIHCTAGKDRTGVAAALLLDLLEVPEDAILEDYRATNRHFDALAASIVPSLAGHGAVETPRAVWEPILRADPDYLAAMFETIRTGHGSTFGYAREVLGLDEAQVAALRSHLLT
jgi:protein-tyrosine phosphatase